MKAELHFPDVKMSQRSPLGFHQHGLNRPALSMGGDGVYDSDINGEVGGRP
ncbi:hypothetical protein ACNKHM_22705 [Shigella sonnei]